MTWSVCGPFRLHYLNISQVYVHWWRDGLRVILHMAGRDHHCLGELELVVAAGRISQELGFQVVFWGGGERGTEVEDEDTRTCLPWGPKAAGVSVRAASGLRGTPPPRMRTRVDPEDPHLLSSQKLPALGFQIPWVHSSCQATALRLKSARQPKQHYLGVRALSFQTQPGHHLLTKDWDTYICKAKFISPFKGSITWKVLKGPNLTAARWKPKLKGKRDGGSLQSITMG